MLPLTKPAPPALTTQFFTQQLPTTVYPNETVATSSPMFFVWNFTENLSARDPGSTQVRFFFMNILNPVSIMSNDNLTALTQLVSANCFTSTRLTPCLSVLATTQLERSFDITDIGGGWSLGGTSFATNMQTLTFRPSSSGVYHLVFLAPNVSSMHVGEIRGFETWTVTTIS